MLQSRSDIVIRKPQSSDAEALSELFGKSWRLAYTGIIPHLHLEGIIRRRTVEWWRGITSRGDGMLVLEVNSDVAGYATFGRARAKGRFQGEIFELYVTPTHQGLGFGEHLFEASRHALDVRRLSGLIVWALTENEQACHFYWRRGGRPVARHFDTLGESKVERVAFGWH
jgi:GNAT superfamily N-acetyltransferase